MKSSFVWFGAWLILPNVVGSSLLTSLNRRLLFRETRRASRGDAQSHSNSAINTLVFRAETRQSQAYISENSKHLNVEGFQKAERGIDQEHRRVSKPTVVHIHV
ncbi:uncharacterized protein F5891DRAFT_1032443 [Suillus fuscotomentosus]|uniref:Secreted protein n=1 Tax=Suillus fuscotomentosus TaxID=1912939 RepID=A0AAD4E6F8_9AGAM|nr:uncharacterized protein F5891DRAFT_1032443 [Suillus fuscotomentosus]KAG1900534.1 hypothetical protein F5891DRAFT_1032443 [Suillus fuscotomentosus]